jgi:hypothetical protein
MSAVSSMQDVRDELAAGIGEVESVQATLISLQNGAGDQSALYSTYKEQVEALEKRAAQIGQSVDDMATRGQEYRSAWRQETSTITDPKLREAARERAEVVKEKYDLIFTDYRAAKDAYFPFIRKLKDVQTFLSNDLTAGGAKAARPAMQEAVTMGDAVKEKSRAVIGEMDRAEPRLSPATAPGE